MDSHYCFFCLKETDERRRRRRRGRGSWCEEEDKENHHNNNVKRNNNKNRIIWLSLERYLNVKQLEESTSPVDLGFCGDCAIILGQIGVLYGRLRRVELELEWKLGWLKDIMTLANRVPSRLSSVREYYSSAKGMDGASLMEQALEWRKSFVRKCKKKLSGSWPKVKIRRLEEEEEANQWTESGGEPSCDDDEENPLHHPPPPSSSSSSSSSSTVGLAEPPETLETNNTVLSVKLEHVISLDNDNSILRPSRLRLSAPCNAKCEELEEGSPPENLKCNNEDSSSHSQPEQRPPAIALDENPVADDNKNVSSSPPPDTPPPAQDTMNGNEATLTISEMVIATPDEDEINIDLKSVEEYERDCYSKSGKDSVSSALLTELEEEDPAPPISPVASTSCRSQETSSSVPLGARGDSPESPVILSPSSHQPSSSDEDDLMVNQEEVVNTQSGHDDDDEPHSVNDNNVSVASLPSRSSSSRQLRAHFRCSTCLKTFSSSEKLQSHRETESHQHGDDDTRNTFAEGDSTDSSESDSQSVEESEEESDDEEDELASSSSGDNDDDCEAITGTTELSNTKRRKRDVTGKKCKPGQPFTGIECGICKVVVRDRTYGISKHFKGHHDVGDMEPGQVSRCDADPQCSAYFRTEHQLRVHKSRAHASSIAEDDYASRRTCDICKIRFASPTSFRIHYKTHHGDLGGVGPATANVFKCDQGGCSAYFLLPVQLKVHQTRVHGMGRRKMGKHVCSVCPSKWFPTNSNLKKHYRSHHDLSRLRKGDQCYKCDQPNCPSYFLTPIQLDTHRREGAHLGKQNLRKSHRQTECHHDDANTVEAEDLESGDEEEDVEVASNNSSAADSDIADFFADEDAVERWKNSRRDKWAAVEATFSKSNKVGEKECRICKMVIKYKKQDIVRHFEILHDVEDMEPAQVSRCDHHPDCSAYFRTQRQLKAHMKKVHKSILPTTITNTTPHPTLNGYDRLLLQNPNEDNASSSRSCDMCRRRFVDAYTCRKHYKTHHDLDGVDPKVFKCDQPGCSAYFRLHLQLQVHQTRVHETGGRFKNKFVCSVCPSKWFPDSKGLKLHYRTHHDLSRRLQNKGTAAEPHKCDQPDCPAYFLTPRQLVAHRRDVHGKGFSCKICGKDFKSRGYLKVHRQRVHRTEVELNFSCSLPGCGKKRFETQKELEAHTQFVHYSRNSNLSKTQKCVKCGKVCGGPGQLTRHMKSHDPKKTLKSYVCEQCGKSFRDRKRLALHRLSHSGPDSWEFQCSICAKKCMTRDKLEEHSRTHTGEKPFVCQHCGVAYAHKHNLRIHVNSKHPEAPDLPRPFNKTNLSSRKGIKRKIVVEEEETDEGEGTESD